jgi:hypothetical protein
MRSYLIFTLFSAIVTALPSAEIAARRNDNDVHIKRPAPAMSSLQQGMVGIKTGYDSFRIPQLLIFGPKPLSVVPTGTEQKMRTFSC